MNIAFVVGPFPKLSETFILNQITGLLDMGHKVEIFAVSNPNEEVVNEDVIRYNLMDHVHYSPKYNTITPKEIKSLFFNFFKDWNKICKALNVFKYGRSSIRLLFTVSEIIGNDYDFDIIHCHFGPNGIFGTYLEDVGIEGKYITTFHGFDVNVYPKRKGENVYQELFEKGNYFTCNTTFTKKRLIGLGCKESKIVVLPVGLKVEFFTPKKIDYKNKPLQILTVARLVEEKGHKYAINAIAKLIKIHPNILYLIVGDGPLKRELENLVSRLGINKNVIFYGAANHSKVLNLYIDSDIFLLPSVISKDGAQEAQGLVLQEAQAMGLPLVSTNIGGIPEGINNKSGFIVPEKDINALMEKLEYLIRNPEIWPEMGAEGRKFVKNRYDMRKLNKQLLDVYESAL
ncbi:glycosyltransferase [Methanococcoides orientis]|uniref:glycosyltransferase n=1 Tax=Methanococcoides orientis TaxID=2822137 RepID=UPI001E55DEBA|nr:glycosyltransferase [Methanococcoides orientis]UGV40304.1 glycosyltransferase [Methanococcoides orientis]